MRLSPILHVAVVVLSSLSADAEPVPADLSPTVGRMTEAVLTGDPLAYMECVDPSDPVLHKEQENWARDLAEHKPLSFAIEIDDAGFAVQRDGSVVVPLTMSWRLGEKGRARRVGFPARFVERDGRWLYAGERWVRVRAAGVEVLVDPEMRSIGLHIASVLPGVRRQIDDMMGVHADRVQQVKVYRSMEHLQQSIDLSYKDPLGGWNEPGEAIKMLGNDAQGGHALRSLLAHEYAHAATFDLGPRATDMPWWALEGVAEYCSAAVTGGQDRALRRVSRWAENDELRTWDQLTDFRGEAMSHQSHVYTQGHHMIAYLADRFGFERVVGWLTRMAQGASLEDATPAAFERTWSRIDADWRESLQAAPEPEP